MPMKSRAVSVARPPDGLRCRAREPLRLRRRRTGSRAGYNNHVALDSVTFTIEKGCLAGLVGPNGSGKSTLLKVMLGLHKPWSGEVLIFGHPSTRPMATSATPPDARGLDVSSHRDGRRADGALRQSSVSSAAPAAATTSSPNRLSNAPQRSRGTSDRRALGRRTAPRSSPAPWPRRPIFSCSTNRSPASTPPRSTICSSCWRSCALRARRSSSPHDLSCVAADFDYAVLINRSVVAFGRPADVFTEENLSAAFERHLYPAGHDHRGVVGERVILSGDHTLSGNYVVSRRNLGAGVGIAARALG